MIRYQNIKKVKKNNDHSRSAIEYTIYSVNQHLKGKKKPIHWNEKIVESANISHAHFQTL